MRGNPGKRALNKREPQPAEFRASPPEHLDEEARTEWKRMVPILKRMRVLTEADSTALGNLCQAYSTMAQAQRQLSAAGLLYKTQSGYIQPSPLMGIVTQNMKIVQGILAEFGLTPASRSRIQTTQPAKPDNKWADIG
jgi:P27 family predicted phage terminase small subunit